MSTAHTVTRTVDPVTVAALADLLGSDVDTAVGAPLPMLWHWAALARWPAPAVLGTDGHPRRGTGLMPDVGLPRRMFAGGTVREHAPVPIGAEVTVASVASDPVEKSGRSGRLAFVAVTTEVRDATGVLLLEESQDIVYTEAREVGPDLPEPVVAAQVPALVSSSGPDSGSGAVLTTDPGLLARYSALTANPHRIHLDWPYATRVEGYPGLVVHGPLMATALAEAARRAGVPRPHAVRHRGLAPLFCGQPADLVVVRDGATAVAEVRTGETAHARLELDPA